MNDCLHLNQALIYTENGYLDDRVQCKDCAKIIQIGEPEESQNDLPVYTITTISHPSVVVFDKNSVYMSVLRLCRKMLISTRFDWSEKIPDDALLMAWHPDRPNMSDTTIQYRDLRELKRLLAELDKE